MRNVPHSIVPAFCLYVLCIWVDHRRIPQQALYWEVPRQGIRPVKEKAKLERGSREGSMKNGIHLKKGGSSSPKQTRMATECGSCLG